MKFVILFAVVTASLLNQAEGSCVGWTCSAARVLVCAGTCADDGVTSEQCMSCLGPLYYRLCRNCIGLYSAIDGLVTYQGSEITCTIPDWMVCVVDFFECEQVCRLEPIEPSCTQCIPDLERCMRCVPELSGLNSTLTSTELATSFSCSPFDWFKCAAKVAECASVCSDGITEPACISCFGGAYDQCKGCIGLGSTELRSVVSQENVLGDCTIHQWTICSGRMEKCVEPCIRYGLSSPQCFSCLNFAAPYCLNCISEDDMDSISQLAAEQQAAVTGSALQQSFNSLGLFTSLAISCGVMLKVVPY